MDRAFLANARLPKRFWYWAIREAAHRVNFLPVSSNPDDLTNPDFVSTPHFKLYGTKPDYRTLFPFGAIGSFRQVRDGNCNRIQFECQGMLGIALGRSKYTKYLL